jgi:phosphatidate phosphatase APP1
MEKQTFAERARWMFADNTRGHAITVTAAGETFILGRTRPNGRLRTTITLKEPPDGLDIHCLAPRGLSVFSDIDDTIRVSHVQDRAALLRGTFLEPFRPVRGMAALYRAWSDDGAQFHYLSATPWQLYVALELGSWELQSNVPATAPVRLRKNRAGPAP